MFQISPQHYGYFLTFADFIKTDEMTQWLDESRVVLRTSPSEFGVVIDMRALKPLAADTQLVMESGQKLYRESGMQRSCVIVSNPTTKMQFVRIARQTGIDAFERYVDASSCADPEGTAAAWVARGEDPDA